MDILNIRKKIAIDKGGRGVWLWVIVEEKNKEKEIFGN